MAFIGNDLLDGGLHAFYVNNITLEGFALYLPWPKHQNWWALAPLREIQTDEESIPIQNNKMSKSNDV